MQFQIPYGRSNLPATLPDEFVVDILEPVEQPAAADPLGLVRSALNCPLGGARLSDFANARTVAIAINDKTRPVPHHILLPPLLECLEAIGIRPDQIVLVIAVGLHAPMSPHEFASVLSETILKRYPVISHDAKDRSGLVFLGETSRRTPIWTNKVFAQADARIVIGNIEPHQFVGFSGGVKSAVIGLGGAETIRHNHAMLTEPGCRLGEYDHNPARQDVEEIGARIGVQFALNAILNQHKQIVHVLAGSPLAVMKAGLPLSRQICQLPVSGPYDFLIVSPGGHPKDINLYQSQKGLTHAAGIMRPGGTMILAAACSEGIGSPSYEAWMEGMTSYGQVIERFKREGFEVGPHKAFLIARDAGNINLRFISGLDPAKARALLLPPGKSLQSAIDQTLSDLPQNARIGILAHASSTIPYFQEEPG